MSATISRRGGSGLLGRFFGSRSSSLPADAALIAARVGLAWIFIYYGGSKLFGWFTGPGPHGIHETSLYFAHAAGLTPGGFFAVLGGITEFFGGIAIALGLFTRLAGLALFADMVIAMITVTWATGFNSAHAPPGYQLNIPVAILALMLALLGPGRFSLDGLIARRLRTGKAGSPEGDSPESAKATRLVS